MASDWFETWANRITNVFIFVSVVAMLLLIGLTLMGRVDRAASLVGRLYPPVAIGLIGLFVMFGAIEFQRRFSYDSSEET